MKRLLVVTQHFAPSTKIGAQRPLRLVRRISEFGWEPRVLTLPAGCQHAADPSLGRDVLTSVPVETVPCWSPWWHAHDWHQANGRWGRGLALAQRVLAKLSYPLLPVDIGYPWVRAAAKRGVAVVRRHGIDAIWATSPPLSALCLARRIGWETGVPYVVDFRDVERANTPALLPLRARRNIRVERAVLKGARGLIYVSPPQVGVLSRKHPFVATMPTRLVYNWFEASEVAQCRPQRYDGPTILHGGFLYGGERRLDGFVKALAMLRQRGQAPGTQIRFVQHGTSGRMDQLADVAAACGLGDAVQIRPSLPREEFLSACRGADILLLVVGHNVGVLEHAGAIPGKLYEYFAACRPILVVGPRDCEAARMVRRLNRGLAAPDDAASEIAGAIERLLQDEGESGPLDLSLEAVREFEASFAVRELATFLTEVCAENRHRPCV